MPCLVLHLAQGLDELLAGEAAARRGGCGPTTLNQICPTALDCIYVSPEAHFQTFATHFQFLPIDFPLTGLPRLQEWLQMPSS